MLKYQNKKNWLLIFLLILSSLESLLALIWLALIPADPKNALLGPFSATRLALMVGAMIASATFALLAFVGWQGQRSDRWSNKFRFFSSHPVFLFNVLALGLLVGLFLLLLSPPNLIPPGSSIAQRVTPLLVWFALICAQWGGFVFARFHQEVGNWLYTRWSILRQWIAKPLTGYILLGFSVLIAFTQIYYSYYNLGDEGNTITIGWLVAKGWRLYDEVFSHHFPFSYLWVASVVKVFGASFIALRISLILLRTLIFAIAMKLSRYTFAVGLMALSWSLLGHFYVGNGLLYHTFTGMFDVAAFVIGLAVLEGKTPGRGFALGTTGILLGLAMLTDPLKLLPAGVLVLAVFFSDLSWPLRIDPVKRGIVRAGTIATMMIVPLAIYALWLISTNSMLDFYQAVIDFNLRVYSKYSPRITPWDIFNSITGFLDLFNEQWRIHLSPYYEWGSFVRLDTWVFTSFFFRLAIVMTSIVSLAQRKILRSFYIYLFAAVILVRGSTYFHASPFVLLSLCVGSFLLSGDLSSTKSSSNLQKNLKPEKIRVKSAIALSLFAWLTLFPMFTWLNIRGAAFLIENKEKMAYSDKLAGIDVDAAYLRKATCNQPGARILIYPYEPIQYFAAQILPASKYHFLLPWVAEIGQEQAISDLAKQPALVLIAREGQVWGYPVQQYLAKLLEYLDQHYIFIEKAGPYQVYMSPKLEKLCQGASNP